MAHAYCIFPFISLCFSNPKPTRPLLLAQLLTPMAFFTVETLHRVIAIGLGIVHQRRVGVSSATPLLLVQLMTPLAFPTVETLHCTIDLGLGVVDQRRVGGFSTITIAHC